MKGPPDIIIALVGNKIDMGTLTGVASFRCYIIMYFKSRIKKPVFSQIVFNYFSKIDNITLDPNPKKKYNVF